MKIALTRTDNPEKHQFYQEWLRAGGSFEVATLSAPDNNLNEIASCDALVLSGGWDIHPKYYGSMQVQYPGAPENFDEKRDEFEIEAFHQAENKGIPILGICRGLQLINVICKGTLIQNLVDQEGNKTHKGNPDKLHRVNIKPGTLLYEIIGTETGNINSAHHQAIDQLGEGLLINSQADDGTIEGIEWQEKSGRSFMLAIQWHPERMFRFQLENSDLSKKIRVRFIDEIKKRKN